MHTVLNAESLPRWRRYPIGTVEPFSRRRIINLRLPGVHAYDMDEPLRLVPDLLDEAPATATATRSLEFEDLVEAEHGGLYGALCLITRDRPEAQDIMQEAFLKLGEVEARDALVRALAALTPRQRASVVLVDLLDYTSEEAARVMGIKAATVRVLASQGRAALKRNA